MRTARRNPLQLPVPLDRRRGWPIEDELAVVESKDTAIFLFQAVRELLLNAVKHARVDTVRVEITRRDARVRVLVADEGVGFDPTQLRLAGGPVGGSASSACASGWSCWAAGWRSRAPRGEAAGSPCGSPSTPPHRGPR